MLLLIILIMISGRYLKALVSRRSHSEKPILIWKPKDDDMKIEVRMILDAELRG